MAQFSFCSQIDTYYPNVTVSTALFLCQIADGLGSFINIILEHQSRVAIVSFSINIIHLIILTRKSLRSSSVNLIMAAVAFFDICTLLIEIEQIIQDLIIYFNNCYQATSYAWILFNTSVESLRDYSRRCSTWLCLSIALLRLLVISNPLVPKYIKLTKPIGALYVISVVLLGSIPISVFDFMKFKINGIIRPSQCHPNGTLVYFIKFSDAFMENNQALLKIATTTNAIVTNIIPCFLYPIFTFFLVTQLLLVNKNRRSISSSKSSAESLRTTHLVLAFTAMFFVAEFPLGVSSSLAYLFFDVPGIVIILRYCEMIFTVILYANFSSHFIICSLMSSQYRSNAMSLATCGYTSRKIDSSVQISTQNSQKWATAARSS
ncbi:G-protein coupled receptors family 1 profile domain-containing protein [Caenorhabditis elegans]|uniref:G-protein coupled receptors family 1 profile domain-containing protein n=1 Tax=Caenorhabditis elegans TaxID=6239 RepID=Q8IFX9_CAEEL|nr:G-protein coupled receptors family 1 profile domain-containing protein [Caenorhabditis elegans]CCD67250.1 G-protein coupled receptors family 1 profile domain-containing protein [Caenorhabditis elegans]|eukprot:NP_503813.2 Serpentine Receptor, class W [Caenorhabditis elegans]